MASKGVSPTGPDFGAQRLRARTTADTAIEPEGLTRRVVLNLMEAFFRRPWLYALPIVLMIALGASSALGAKQVYQSVGTLQASGGTVLQDLTDAVNTQNGAFGWETPAQFTARNINESLRTDEFLDLVAERAGIPRTNDLQASITRSVLAQSTFAFPDGDSLVRVGARADDPTTAHDLAAATIQSYAEYVVDASVQDSTKAEEFLQGLVDEATIEADAARQALNAFLIDNPVADETNRPLPQTLEIQRLQSVLERAEAKRNGAQDQYDTARLTTEQARTVIEQRLRVVDEPQLNLTPQPRLRKAITTIILFGALGSMISFALLLLVATLDRTIRIPNDITARFGVEVLAVVPGARR